MATFSPNNKLSLIYHFLSPSISHLTTTILRAGALPIFTM